MDDEGICADWETLSGDRGILERTGGLSAGRSDRKEVVVAERLSIIYVRGFTPRATGPSATGRLDSSVRGIHLSGVVQNVLHGWAARGLSRLGGWPRLPGGEGGVRFGFGSATSSR